jgi:hypothetical protein
VTAPESLLRYLRTAHDDAARTDALRAVWVDRAAVSTWTSTTTPDLFIDDALPIGVMGGSSQDKIIVLTVNPGHPIDGETALLSSSADAYVNFHEDFFHEFPQLLARAAARPRAERQKATSPFWNNLPKFLELVIPRLEAEARWEYLARACVVQDLIPFHSKRKQHAHLLSDGEPLHHVACATIEGIGGSAARGVLILSRDACRLLPVLGIEFEEHSIDEDLEATLRRKTPPRRTAPRSVVLRTGAFGNVPFVAVDNDAVSQPTFPWASGYSAGLQTHLASWVADIESAGEVHPS